MTIAVFNSDELHILKKIWEDLSERSDHMGINKQTFLEYIPVCGILGDRLFSKFDKELNGYISLHNFIEGLTILCLGTITEQSKFLFDVFDVNKNGNIYKDDLITILNYIPQEIFCNCDLKKRLSHESIDKIDYKSYTNYCYYENAFSNSEYINYNEFHDWFKRTPALIGYIKNIIPCTSEDDTIDINDKFPLWKKGEKTGLLFKRYCLMKGNCLYYYYNKFTIRPKGIIFLSGCIVEQINDTDMESKGYYPFQILRQYIEDDVNVDHHDHEKRIFYCESLEKRNDLIHKLQKMSHIIPFEEDYILGKKIGKGAFSVVHECINKTTLKKYAVKIINKNIFKKVSRAHLNNEIAILRLTSHPNLIHLEETYEDKENIYIVIELVEDGDFFEFMIGKQCFTDDMLKPIIKQLCEALAYLHEFGIVHCDIKPENLLFNKSTGNIIKLTDFGLSKMILSHQKIEDACGTLQYVSPEILELKGCGVESDMWSVGIIMYLLLNGKMPYDKDTVVEMIDAFDNQELIFKSNVSENAKDIVLKLLTKDPKKRITAKNALLHPFFT